MFRIRMFIAGTALSLAAGTAAHAQASNTATQTVGIQVSQINQITVSGSPDLIITTATAGSDPDQATASGTYAITTNDTAKKITVEINSNMPSNVTLKVQLEAPAGHGTSAGFITLSTTPVTAVSGVNLVAASGLAVDYTLDATAAAVWFAHTTRTATFTITSMP